jgi:hypothetical protein
MNPTVILSIASLVIETTLTAIGLPPDYVPLVKLEV